MSVPIKALPVTGHARTTPDELSATPDTTAASVPDRLFIAKDVKAIGKAEVANRKPDEKKSTEKRFFKTLRRLASDRNIRNTYRFDESSLYGATGPTGQEPSEGPHHSADVRHENFQLRRAWENSSQVEGSESKRKSVWTCD